MLQLEGMSTAKIVLFHQGSTELRRCEICVFFLPVNILTGVTRQLLGPHDTLPCVLIDEGVDATKTGSSCTCVQCVVSTAQWWPIYYVLCKSIYNLLHVYILFFD